MPLSAGNIRETSFVDLWEKSDVFNSFRYPHLKGHMWWIANTRTSAAAARALMSIHGDWLDRGSMVSLHSPGVARRSKSHLIRPKKAPWRGMQDSGTRLNRIPLFLARHGEEKGVEKHARENSIPLITIELMEGTPQENDSGNEAPVFKF